MRWTLALLLGACATPSNPADGASSTSTNDATASSTGTRESSTSAASQTTTSSGGAANTTAADTTAADTTAADTATTGGSPVLADGVYMSCDPSEAACLEQLDVLGAAGFRYVLNYDQPYATMAEQLAFLDRAQSLGIAVIWPVNAPTWSDGSPYSDEYGSLFADCGCADNDARLQYLVDQLAPHPALWGWYVVDETPDELHDQVASFSARLHELDPEHPRLVVHYEAPELHLPVFADVADVLALDDYPIGEICDTDEALARVVERMAGTLAVADQMGTRAAFVLQAFSWAQYPYDPPCERWPTAEEMRAMYHAAIDAGGFEFVLWYNYADILDSDDPAGHWADLLSARAP